jgi:hypothetical protein
MAASSSKEPWTPLVLRPSVEDVLNTSFEAYVTKHEPRILKAGGACKIVLPAALKPRKAGYGGLDHLVISRAIRQSAIGTRGIYRMIYVEQRPMDLAAFRVIAEEEGLKVAEGPDARSGNSAGECAHLSVWLLCLAAMGPGGAA